VTEKIDEVRDKIEVIIKNDLAYGYFGLKKVFDLF
jgi:hypothetical protein